MKGLGKVKNLGSKMKTYAQAVKALGINIKDQATEMETKTIHLNLKSRKLQRV